MKLCRFSKKRIHCAGRYFSRPGATSSGPLLLSFMSSASSISLYSKTLSVSGLISASLNWNCSNCSSSPSIYSSSSKCRLKSWGFGCSWLLKLLVSRSPFHPMLAHRSFNGMFSQRFCCSLGLLISSGSSVLFLHSAAHLLIWSREHFSNRHVFQRMKNVYLYNTNFE